jgi:hypothetical protein
MPPKNDPKQKPHSRNNELCKPKMVKLFGFRIFQFKASITDRSGQNTGHANAYKNYRRIHSNGDPSNMKMPLKFHNYFSVRPSNTAF